MIEHLSPLSGVACATDGAIATAGYDNQLILWDGSSKRAIARACHDHLVNHCAFNRDGDLLISSSSDHSARLWSVPELKLQAAFTGHTDDVEMSAFSPDDCRIATASRDNRLRIFDRTGRLVVLAEGHEADVLSVSWTPDGNGLVSSSDDGTVRRWCARTGTLRETLRMDGTETDTVVVDAKGHVYSGNDRGEIHTLTTKGVRVRQAHDAGVKRLAIEPSARLLVSTSYDRALKLWRIAPNSELTLVESTTMPASIWARSAAFTPCGKIVLGTFGSSYATYDPRSHRWNLEHVHETRGFNAVALFRGATYAVGDAGVVYRDGHEFRRLGSLCNFLLPWEEGIIAGGHLGTLFDVLTGRELHQHQSPLNCATLLPHDRVLVGSYTGHGIVVELREDVAGRRSRSLALHPQAVKGVASSGDRFFTVSACGEAALWRLSDMTLLSRMQNAHSKIANGVTALPCGNFASVSRDLHLRIWTDNHAHSYMSPHSHSIKCLCVSRDGRWIATGSYGGQVAFFDLENRTWRHVVRPTTAGISSITTSPGDASFIACDYEGGMHLLSPTTARSGPSK